MSLPAFADFGDRFRTTCNVRQGSFRRLLSKFPIFRIPDTKIWWRARDAYVQRSFLRDGTDVSRALWFCGPLWAFQPPTGTSALTEHFGIRVVPESVLRARVAVLWRIDASDALSDFCDKKSLLPAIFCVYLVFVPLVRLSGEVDIVLVYDRRKTH